MSELKNVAQVKEEIKRDYLSQIDNVKLGLSEYNDRTRQWRTSIIFNNKSLGLVYYDASTGELDKDKSTSISFSCYNEPTKNGVRQQTYPVMNTKDVHISDIVVHKLIPTHYDNFLDTAIFTYHMLDFDCQNGFSNTYRFVYDLHSIYEGVLIYTNMQPESRTTDETIFDSLLSPIDTAEDNLKQEEHR